MYRIRTKGKRGKEGGREGAKEGERERENYSQRTAKYEKIKLSLIFMLLLNGKNKGKMMTSLCSLSK